MAFPLDSREKLAAFDRLCIDYGRAGNFLTDDCPALRLLYDALSARGLDQRELWWRVAHAYEIKLTRIHIMHAISRLAGIENKHYVNAEPPLNDPLADTRRFGIAMRRVRAAFDAVVRIRSLFDKLFLYVAREAEIHGFEKSANRGKSMSGAFFQQFPTGVGLLTQDLLVRAKSMLRQLEDQFRTPELHGSGTLRTWAFDPVGSWPVQQSSDVMGFFNLASEVARAVFHDASTRATSIEGGPAEAWTP